jgi:transposase
VGTWRFQANRNLFCILQLAKTESIITVQRGFRIKYHTEPPTNKTITEWYKKFEETGCLCSAKRTGRPGPSPETVDHVRESFTRSPQKSTRRASRELEMSHVTGVSYAKDLPVNL